MENMVFAAKNIDILKTLALFRIEIMFPPHSIHIPVNSLTQKLHLPNYSNLCPGGLACYS